jgi:multidrug efflux pump subunit AcrA (membrane-fusion protein)
MMTESASQLPTLSVGLKISGLTQAHRAVIKNSATGAFFECGRQELFLLRHFDGRQSPQTICTAFEAEFHDALEPEEVIEFGHIAVSRGIACCEGATAGDVDAAPINGKRGKRFNPLYWRKSLWDPDRTLSWLAPKIWFLWTPAFAILMTISICCAALVLWMHWADFFSLFQSRFEWRLLFFATLTLISVTVLHELAHGLTCKHYGGEVHEIGFLLLFLMPGMYCNVTDAWLFPEKLKRLYVTLAGGLFELSLWSLAIHVWRITPLESYSNYLAWVVASVSGVRVLFNFSPFLKLDGYYLLSDWLEIPNLRARSMDYFSARVKTFLWGAPAPFKETRSGLLFGFGATSYVVSYALLGMVLFGLIRFASAVGGMGAATVVILMGAAAFRPLISAFTGKEVIQMFHSQHLRSAIWLVALLGLGVLLSVPIFNDRVGGDFQLRPIGRYEVRAPHAAFLDKVNFEEGDRVSQNANIAQMSVPDLESRILQKQAEIKESMAQCKQLETGTRPEVLENQREFVKRAKAWRNLAKTELTKKQTVLEETIVGLDRLIDEQQIELEYTQERLKRIKGLAIQEAVAQDELSRARARERIYSAKLEQARAEKRRVVALGVSEAEVEVARRENELATAEAQLALMDAGTRPEAIQAERAHLQQLQEELSYLKHQRQDLQIRATRMSGCVITPHLNERVGQYFVEGALICEIEDASSFEVVIELAEADAACVSRGQPVKIKIRALPFKTFEAKVTRIASAAQADDKTDTSKLAIYCELKNTNPALRSGMRGYARIYRGYRSLAQAGIERLLKLVRTEFWW